MKRFNRSHIAAFIALTALLSCSMTALAKTETIPSEFWGVVLGTTDIDAAAESLEAQGWKPEVEAGDDEDDKKFYLFIFGMDRPINYEGVAWGSAMFVTSEENTHTINAVSFMSNAMDRAKATSVFKKLAGTLKTRYRNFINKDESDRLRIRKGGNYIHLSLRESSTKAGAWTVAMIVYIGDTSTVAPASSRKTSGTTVTTRPATTPAQSSMVFGPTIPTTLWGVGIGNTKLPKAIKVLKKKGMKPELNESGQLHISVYGSDNDIKILGHDVLLVNFFFDDSKKVCTDIYFAIVFDNGSDAREFVLTAREEMTDRYPGCMVVDEQNMFIMKQNGIYLKVERSYLEDSAAWVGWVIISNTMPS